MSDQLGARPSRRDHGGADELIERLLTLLADELGVEVALQVFEDVDSGTPPDGLLQVPVRGTDGVAYGRLVVRPVEGAGTAAEEVAFSEVVARLVGERLEREASERSAWRHRVERVHQVLQEDALVMRYQPVLDLRDDTVIGVEALSTFPGRGEVSPDRWYADADAVGLGVALEVAAVQLALEVVPALPAPVFLAVNVSPATALSEGLRRALEGVELDRVVFEITEHAEITDYETLNVHLRPYREKGLRLAVDDAGAGFASLRHIVHIAPDIIKLDRTLVAGIDRDPVLRALTYSIAAFASATDAMVIAEGIETAGELNALRFLGIECGQGYHLCRPGALADVLAPPTLELDAVEPVSHSSAG